MKKKQPVGIRILLGFVSFLLCVCLFVTTLAAILILDVRVLTGKQQLQDLISDALFSAVTPPRAMASGRPGAAGAAVRPVTEKLAALRLAESDSGESTDKLLLQWGYDAFKEQFGDEIPVTFDQVEDFFDRSTAKDFLADKVSSVINDIYNGTSTTTITNEEIRELLTENKELVEECFQVESSEEVIDTAVEWVEESGVTEYIKPKNLEIILSGGSLDDILSGSAPDDAPVGSGQDASGSIENVGSILDNMVNGTGDVGVSEILALVRGITSTTVLACVIGAAAVLIGLLFLANLRRVYVAMIDSGVTFLLAGGLMLVPVFLSGMLTTMIEGPAPMLIQKVLGMTATVSGGTAGLGLALIIGGIVVAVICKKKANAVVEEALVEAAENCFPEK